MYEFNDRYEDSDDDYFRDIYQEIISRIKPPFHAIESWNDIEKGTCDFFNTLRKNCKNLDREFQETPGINYESIDSMKYALAARMYGLDA